MTLAHFITTARKCSVPLIAISTPDPAATFEAIRDAVTSTPHPKAPNPAIFEYRPSVGAVPANQAAEAEAQRIAGDMDGWYDRTGRPDELLTLAARELPAGAVIVCHLGHLILEQRDPRTLQAVWDCRDAFKRNFRTLILMGPYIQLPPELVNDAMTYDERLPDAVQLQGIIEQSHKDAGIDPPTSAALAQAIPALTGLAAFTAEQVVAMSLKRDGMDIPALWERKRQLISATPGLSVYNGPETFANVGGCQAIKSYLSGLLTGANKPGAVVFADEIEKGMAGAAFDTSGTTQDQHGALLQYMQDSDARGCIFIGPPGTAKSAIAKAAANEGGIPCIQLDLGGLKSSLVGSSEARIRAALKVIDAVSAGRPLFLATCNSIGALSIELRRRFNRGTFFFDLPTEAERGLIWDIYAPATTSRPPDSGWTGAEIRACAMIAADLGCSLAQAAAYIVPVSKSAGQMIQRLRQDASGNYLSAGEPGTYEAKTQPAPSLPNRGITVADYRGGNA